MSGGLDDCSRRFARLSPVVGGYQRPDFLIPLLLVIFSWHGVAIEKSRGTNKSRGLSLGRLVCGLSRVLEEPSHVHGRNL